LPGGDAVRRVFEESAGRIRESAQRIRSGGAEATTALADGHLMIGGGHPSEVIPHIKTGRFKGLAALAGKPKEVVKDIEATLKLV